MSVSYDDHEFGKCLSIDKSYRVQYLFMTSVFNCFNVNYMAVSYDDHEFGRCLSIDKSYRVQYLFMTSVFNCLPSLPEGDMEIPCIHPSVHLGNFLCVITVNRIEIKSPYLLHKWFSQQMALSKMSVKLEDK